MGGKQLGMLGELLLTLLSEAASVNIEYVGYLPDRLRQTSC
jgi:cytochrome c-type biogenesis protein CcmE